MTPHQFNYPRVVPLKSGPSAHKTDPHGQPKVKPSPPAKSPPRRTQGR